MTHRRRRPDTWDRGGYAVRMCARPATSRTSDCCHQPGADPPARRGPRSRARSLPLKSLFARAARLNRGNGPPSVPFAAPGAVIHTPSGPVPGRNLSCRAGPTLPKPCSGNPARWRSAVMALLPLRKGAIAIPIGTVGNFLTGVGAARRRAISLCLRCRRPRCAAATAAQAVRRMEISSSPRSTRLLGLVASCPRGGEIPPPPAIPIGEDGKGRCPPVARRDRCAGVGNSARDGTRFAAARIFLRGGAGLTAFEQSLTPPGGQ